MFRNYIKKIAKYILLMGFILTNNILVFSMESINNLEIEHYLEIEHSELLADIPQDEEDVTKTIIQLDNIFKESCQFINLASDLSSDLQENSDQMLNEFNTHKTIKPLYISIILISCLYLSSLQEDVENKFSPENKLFFLKNLKKHAFINAVEEKNLFNSELLLNDLQKLHTEMSEKTYKLFVQEQLNRDSDNLQKEMPREEYHASLEKKLKKRPEDLILKNLQAILYLRDIKEYSNEIVYCFLFSNLDSIEEDKRLQYMESKKKIMLEELKIYEENYNNLEDIKDSDPFHMPCIRSFDIISDEKDTEKDKYLQNPKNKKDAILQLLSYSAEDRLKKIIQIYEIHMTKIERDGMPETLAYILLKKEKDEILESIDYSQLNTEEKKTEEVKYITKLKFLNYLEKQPIDQLEKIDNNLKNVNLYVLENFNLYDFLSKQLSQEEIEKKRRKDIENFHPSNSQYNNPKFLIKQFNKFSIEINHQKELAFFYIQESRKIVEFVYKEM